MIKFPGSLHNHSDYSNLRLRDSINTVKELIDYSIELGHGVIAITEHETVSNAVKVEKYYKKIKEKNPDFKVILGNEIYLCRDGLNGQNFNKENDRYFHFILLAKDAIGHEQIRELSTRAWMRSYVSNKMVRVPTYYQDIIEIIGKNPGHIIGSTACLGGFLATKIIQWAANPNEDFYSKIENWLQQMEQIFGKNNFYLEMQPSNDKEQILVNKEIIKLSNNLNIPYIITTDSHYEKKEDAAIHEAFLKSQDGEREVADFYKTTYHMSDEEIKNFFNYLTEEEIEKAYTNIINIKNSCEEYSLLKSLRIPQLYWGDIKTHSQEVYNSWINKIPYLKNFIESPYECDKKMADLIITKLDGDVRLQYQESFDELNNNLEITWISSEVNKARWSSYFLNLREILNTCWDAGSLIGPGRGSGVGFYLLYILDIIQINKLWESTQCYSWRFLNPSRVSVLDIDTDIEGNKRAQVLQSLREKYGYDRVANVITFGTEGSKQAIQTAARGLGIDNDIALYISSLIPSDRGKTRTLAQCYYGDEENDFQPISLFIQQMHEYPELWKVAQKIEGLVCRMGEHAGGVIFVDEPFTKSTALAKVPNGDTVTQFDLHDCEDVSLIKYDLLSIEALDKMHACLDLLCEYNYIEKQLTLKETYEKYLGIYNIERTAPKMWKMIHNHEIESLFQMEKQSGVQGIALTKPENVDDLAVLNSVIRLMAQEKDAEQPLEKYARFKSNVNYWYQEMNKYGLTNSEQEILKPIIGQAYGICESQEKFMTLVQIPECGGFDLTWADRLRKSIAKKNPAEYDKLTEEYFLAVKEKKLSVNLCKYVWNVLVATSRGYGFNASHTLAYSLVALQEMNLAYKYPIIFWNCACLITDSGGGQDNNEEQFFDEVEEEIVDIYEPENFEEYEYIDAPDKKTKVKKKRTKTTDYKKIATAIGKMTQAGIKIVPPDINNSFYTFTPDVENNRILFGLSGMLNVGEDIIQKTINNRPYSSVQDYIQKVRPKKSSMISLIKGGAFDKLMERKTCMGWYIWETCDKKNNITLQNMPGLIKYQILSLATEEQKLALRVYEFNKYLKFITKANPTEAKYYRLDNRAIEFLNEINCENMIEVFEGIFIINEKIWDKKYQSYMNIFRHWIAADKDNILKSLNEKIFLEDWNKYAKGNYSSWEMEALCFYYHEHELKNINKFKYNINEFNLLPTEPEIERSFQKGDKTINLFKLSKICGTCIAKDKNKSTVSLLTTSGVVTVKFRKEYFAIFDKQISEKQSDGTKKVIERSWFNRGSKILIQGIRSGENFIPKKYNSTPGHQLYKIDDIDKDGNLILRSERYKGVEEEDGI